MGGLSTFKKTLIAKQFESDAYFWHDRTAKGPDPPWPITKSNLPFL